MLDVEMKGSPSLLDLKRFDDPWSYTLRITRNDETRDQTIDLVETFNYLLGLRVRTRSRIRGVLMITGELPDGDKVLVLWRRTAEVDDDALDAWFERLDISTRDQEFAAIYVNGDSNLENQRRQDETWKVRLIEAEFHRLMFDVADV
jgi:adenine-specific DNA-methyltransferase